MEGVVEEIDVGGVMGWDPKDDVNEAVEGKYGGRKNGGRCADAGRETDVKEMLLCVKERKEVEEAF